MKFDQKGFQRTTGQILRVRRKQEGHTQEHVAEVLEMNRASYANLESGRQRIPADVIWRLANYYCIPEYKLLPKAVLETVRRTGTTADAHVAASI